MGDESRIWIGGLPDRIEESQINKEYEKFGTIKNIQIRSNPGAPSFAFVQYTSRRDAEDAVKSTNQEPLFGMRFVKVSWAGSSKGGKGKGKDRRSRSPRRRSPYERRRRRSPSPRHRSWSGSRPRAPRRVESRARSPPPRPDGRGRQDSRRRSPPCARRPERSPGARSPDRRRYSPPQKRLPTPPPERSGLQHRGGKGNGPTASQKQSPSRQRPNWYQPPPSEVQGKYRVKIEKLPADMGWQELKQLGASFAKNGMCTFSRTNRDCTGVLEFTTREDLNRAIDELDGRRFSGSDVRVSAYEENRPPRR